MKGSHTGGSVRLDYATRDNNRKAIDSAADIAERDEHKPGVRRIVATLVNGRWHVALMTGYKEDT